MASAARISHEAGLVDKLGSFVLGLGYGAPGYDSAALCLVRLTPRGILDPGFGTNGFVITPLRPLGNRDRVTVTAQIEDAGGRAMVVGFRDLWTLRDSNVQVIVAARYTATGALDPSFGERGIVTTRIDRDIVTQALAAALDGDGRLLVAGYNGGPKRDSRGKYDDWPIRVILLRYTTSGVLDTSFGTGGVASHVLAPGRRNEHAGRDFLYYDYGRTKAAGVILDRRGRPVVASAIDDGRVRLVRFTREGVLDSSFGTAGTVDTPVGGRSGVSSLLWDAEGRLLAAGTSDSSAVVLRYSADGALDGAFGEGGIQRTPIGDGMRVSAALQEADGHVLVAASGSTSVRLARYDRDGRPDRRTGSNGAIGVELDRTVATVAGLAIDDTGTPVVTAASDNGIFFVRFNRGGGGGREELPGGAERASLRFGAAERAPSRRAPRSPTARSGALTGDRSPGGGYWLFQRSFPTFQAPPSLSISIVPVAFALSESTASTVNVAPFAVGASFTIFTSVRAPMAFMKSNMSARSAAGVDSTSLRRAATQYGSSSSTFRAASNAVRYFR